MSETSIIEDKKKEKNNDSKTKIKKPNQWASFIVSIIINIIICIIYGFIGANFIFFTTAPRLELEKYFPTNLSSYFSFINEVKQKGGQENQRYSCYKRPAKDFNFDYFKSSLGFGQSDSWPFSLYKEEMIPGIFQSFKNWFSMSIAKTFILSHDLIRKWINIFEPNKSFLSNETLQLFVIAPITLFFGQFLSMLIGFFGFIYKSFGQEWTWSLLGLLLGYTTLIAFIVMLVESLKFVGSFLFLPAISNYKLLGRILKCNANSIAMLFGALTIGSATTYLDNTISTSMTFVYIILLIKILFF